jgi:hypothetical protein
MVRERGNQALRAAGSALVGHCWGAGRLCPLYIMDTCIPLPLHSWGGQYAWRHAAGWRLCSMMVAALSAADTLYSVSRGAQELHGRGSTVAKTALTL